jgi:hypothetical protein
MLLLLGATDTETLDHLVAQLLKERSDHVFAVRTLAHWLGTLQWRSRGFSSCGQWVCVEKPKNDVSSRCRSPKFGSGSGRGVNARVVDGSKGSAGRFQ